MKKVNSNGLVGPEQIWRVFRPRRRASDAYTGGWWRDGLIVRPDQAAEFQRQEAGMSNMQQNPDGSWTEAEPLGWQGHGIDWEVDLDHKPMCAEGYDEDVLVAKVTARTRIGLARKMRRAEKRAGLPRNSVLS